MPDEYKRSEKKRPEAQEINNSEKIKISYFDQDFFGDTIRTFTVQLESQEENVSITVKGKDGNLVLYSDENYNYNVSEKVSTFRIPVWPPQEMTFSYIADTLQESEIIVTETIRSQEDKIEIFRNSIKIPGKNSSFSKEKNSEI